MSAYETISSRDDRLAAEILEYAKQTLTVELRFLDAALNRPRLFVLPQGGVATDGNSLGYDPRFVLKSYTREQNSVPRAYLHCVLHCLFRHIYQAAAMDRVLWDIACDAAVEYVICGLEAASLRCEREEIQWKELTALKTCLHQVTAERIYRYYRDQNLTAEEIVRLEGLFHTDDHFPWYTPQPLECGENRAGGNQGGGNQAQSETGKQTEGGSGAGDESVQGQETDETAIADPEEEWQEIASQTQVRLEAENRKKGQRNTAMIQSLKSVRKENYDYRSFLRKFAVLGEQVKLDADSFDPIFYTYGLQQYRNLPLIEPLETSEDRHVKEFVIAIDTSGSVQGPLVQAFIQKTYNILKSTESFASRVNVHIIQCDNEVREHIKITSLTEFDRYLRSMVLKGFGGTDFRPVFRYVNELIDRKEFRSLRGLIYFTDGRGEYPRRKPPYETAFVFLEGEDNAPRVPPWIIQLTLPKEEIEEV